MLLGDNWPIHTRAGSAVAIYISKINSQSNHFLDNCFNPCLEKRILLRDSIDGGLASCSIVQICLMKHEGIMMKPEEMAGIGLFLNF